MDTNRFLKLRSLFDQAVQLAEAERDAFFVRACQGDAALLSEARELLRAHEGDSAPTVVTASPPDSRLVGPYRLIRELGSGGMGTVYLAVRDDGAFRKQVAVKLMRKDQVSADLLTRFQEERQLLANLDHPNVSRILDGGQTPDGLPYFVMEYVEGEPLDKYCDSHRLNLGDRIRLFRQVCLAVHYLHQNFVVHRDLKPSNILVTPGGDAKLLDFGIAKLQAPAVLAPDPLNTAPSQRLMTPVYASPEQISGAPIGKASDIYSLGVILYTLLTGRLPFADPGEKLAGSPPPPSANIREDLQRTPETTAQLRRRIVGDLDNIVLKCLRPEPAGRYGSAAEFADDLQRFLDGHSVKARRDPLTERMFKMVKRNRIAVAVCALVLVLCGLGAWQTVEARIQTQRAEKGETELARVLRALGGNDQAALDDIQRLAGVRSLRQALEKERTGPMTGERRKLLDRGVQYLDQMRPYAARNAVLSSELAETYQQVGTIYEENQQDRALSLYQSALLSVIEASGGNPENTSHQPQYDFLVKRIQALGGTVAPIHPLAPPAPRIHQAAQNTPPIVESPVEAAAAPAAQPKEDAKTKERYVNVSAKCEAAEEAYAQIRAQSAQLGQIPHPDITTAYSRMKIALRTAQRELDEGKTQEARDSLDVAEASANKVLRAAGGN